MDAIARRTRVAKRGVIPLPQPDDMLTRLRKRIADHPKLNALVENAFAAYVRRIHDRGTWDRRGFEPLDEAVASGEPVIVVLWHQRLFMASYCFPVALGPITSLTTSARAGRLAGQVQVRFGFDTIPMSSHKRHITLSREVLRRIRAGSSVGIAADGPGGPHRVLSPVPIAWARVSGVRVFAVAFSARRMLRTPTWDHLMLPLPGTRGVLTCREWTQTVPRDADEAELERLRLSLEATLDAVTDEADIAMGRRPEQVQKRPRG